MKHSWLAILACIPLLAAAADNDISKVNGAIRVAAGEHVGDVETVNGSIHIEADATAEDVNTVNGSIQIGDGASVESLETVNGGINLGQRVKAHSLETVNGGLRISEGTRIEGKVSTVNGGVWMAKDADVAGKLATVNGGMMLQGAHVGGGLETVNGDINVGAGSRVEGGILVERPSFNLLNWHRKTPRIVIGPAAIVQGSLKFEHEVELYVSDSAKTGRIDGAKPIMFSGDSPKGVVLNDPKMQVEK
jgi:DUF4097 and DUF4098 domain-containing protein YvlB